MRKIIFVLALSLGFYSLSAQTIYFCLTPSISTDQIKKNGTYIKDFLQKETGLTIVLVVPKSYDAMVDYFGEDKQYFGILSSQSYVVAHKKHGATVKLRTIRYGSSVYYGQIITLASSSIKKVQDIQGKSIAYTDKLSTSGYLYPKNLLEKSNITPGKIQFVQRHDDVVKLVYEGKVDAGATFYSPPAPDGTIHDARARVKSTYPDVEKKVVIVAITEAIPNDPIVFSKKFKEESAKLIYIALVKLAATEKGKEILLDLYGTEGFVRASDADYNSIRDILK